MAEDSASHNGLPEGGDVAEIAAPTIRLRTPILYSKLRLWLILGYFT